MIILKDIHKSYGSKEVLKGVNLSVQSGSIHGLIGINGAGKTTLFNCITKSHLFTGQVDLGENSIDSLAYLMTHPEYMSRMTGEEYLILMCKAKGVPIPDLASKNVFELPLNKYAQEYSTGMKKKLAFMSNLIVPHDIFILDEPFNGVDLQSNLLINEIIFKLKSEGKTIFISSHIFETLKGLCDQISVLEEGVISKNFEPSEFEKVEDEIKEKVMKKQSKLLNQLFEK